MSGARDAGDGVHDFDFLRGVWRVDNRRLVAPLTGSAEWMEFSGTSRVEPLWDGLANFEEWEADAPDGHISAISLHLHNPLERQWSLHWATRSSGRVGIPTVGRFANGRGVFHDREVYNGRPILLRIVWEPLGANACRFEQAFSTDAGSTWEPNWIMELTREP